MNNSKQPGDTLTAILTELLLITAVVVLLLGGLKNTKEL